MIAPTSWGATNPGMLEMVLDRPKIIPKHVQQGSKNALLVFYALYGRDMRLYDNGINDSSQNVTN